MHARRAAAAAVRPGQPNPRAANTHKPLDRISYGEADIPLFSVLVKQNNPPLANGRPDKGGPRRRVSSRMSLPPPNGRLGEAKRWPALKRNERPYNRRRGPRPNDQARSTPPSSHSAYYTSHCTKWRRPYRRCEL
ncbi:hypothetical protein VFPFJ_06342 [Purpureocillium lilacinum]|uniref:Uncharacterized protein n=1 Tax=Purpureocillium lilacinum TaxID=33203 RepID=A0A179HJW3_PURLI|nr:hypothetical protein VFPFJ_06342 [Purpureocillium lilacinum]OAQ89928.1 hypothetical protein VFPFJ_06342 [Purpureocillium lilacinum]